MGRGRAKAKQTRVARDLKYRPVDTDFASLERELRGDAFVDDTVNGSVDEIHEIPDPYADLVDDFDDDDYDERRSS